MKGRTSDRETVTGSRACPDHCQPSYVPIDCELYRQVGMQYTYLAYSPHLLIHKSGCGHTHPAHIPHPIWEHCIALSNKRRPHSSVCHTTNGKQELFALCNGITACVGPRLTVHHLTHHPLPLFSNHPRAGPVEPHLPISAWDLCDHQPSYPPCGPLASTSPARLPACLPALSLCLRLSLSPG